MKRQSPAKGSVAKRAKADSNDNGENKKDEHETKVDALCTPQEMVGNKVEKEGMC